MIKKLLFTLLFGMLVLPLANAQTSSMKIETYKIDNVSTRGLNPNTKGDEEFDLGDGPGWGNTLIFAGEYYPHRSIIQRIKECWNPDPNSEFWNEYGLNLIMKFGRKQ